MERHSTALGGRPAVVVTGGDAASHWSGVDTPAEPDDAELAARSRTDPEAFGVLYTRYLPRIHGFVLRRCGDRHLADDLTAVVFERAWAGIGRVEVGAAGLGPWLYRIAANELATHYRRNSRKERALDRLARAPITGVEDPADAFGLRSDIDAVRAALGRIPPRHQEVIALRYLAGLSPQETASAMDTTPQVIAALLHRALGSLERALQREVGNGER